VINSSFLQVDDDISQENIFTYLILEKKNIPLQRYSCDKGSVNKYGNLLLECYHQLAKISNKFSSSITKSLPIEVLELKFPIRATFLEKFECVINSSSTCTS
jgi:hypothetical protein